MTVDGNTRILDKPFLVIATQNPIETAGTFTLPEAQLDRFMMQLSMGFPTESEELSIMERFISKNPIEELTPVCSKDEISAMGALAATVYADISIRKYIVDIVNATRNNSNISSGVSPRGTLALLKASQVYAAIRGRDFVTPEDVKTLAVPVLAHRIVSYTNMAKNANQAKLINEILETVAVPAEDFSNARK